MKLVQFKTTINCDSCIKTVTPVLNEILGADEWSVDTKNANKTLTVEAETIDTKQILEAVSGAGFKIEEL